MRQEKCKLSGNEFCITDAEETYCREQSIPLPTTCPTERLRNMLIFRNRMHLYHARCNYTNTPMLSGIAPESGFNVYDVDIWESDKWDALSYGRNYDFNRPFFEQYYELLREVPLPNLAVNRSTMENSDYTQGITSAKNCYLLFASTANENCMFSKTLLRCRDVLNSIFVADSELIYECEDIQNGYNLKFSKHCANCRDSAFLLNCVGCQNCHGCTNLHHKQYCLYNQQLTKDDYCRRVAKIDLGSYRVLTDEHHEFERLSERSFYKYYFGKNNENSSGNYLNNTKNCLACYLTSNSQDLEHSIFIDNARASFFFAFWGNGSELIYNSVSCGDNSYNLKFCADCWTGTHDLEYCCVVRYNSNNCFGCVGLKRNAYCILNKQYSKKDYFDMVVRIKNHMRATGEYGLFFPHGLSPYYYNHSEAQEFFPLVAETAISRGFRWNVDKADERPASAELPDHIIDTRDSILDETLKCRISGKLYRVVKQELEFHRKHKLALPRVAPMVRLQQRASFFNLDSLVPRSCDKCGAAIETIYDQRNNKRIYCESCYYDAMF
ncbi:MAG: hypothetical protein IT291_07930 [Deltaproteobacteria bacterium]|nr:hypothetical protein [Deltaproteobacteria bacterium]